MSTILFFATFRVIGYIDLTIVEMLKINIMIIINKFIYYAILNYLEQKLFQSIHETESNGDLTMLN